MNRRLAAALTLTLTLTLTLAAAPLAELRGQGAPWDTVGRIIGAPPTPTSGGYRFNVPRSDLVVRVGDVTVAPAIALVTWAGFGVAGVDTVMMGDLVATAAELKVVLRQLADEGIAVTAVHNHLVGESPAITYVHYEGRGAAVTLAERVARVIARTAAPRPVRPAAAAPLAIDTALVFRELGARGRASGAIVQLGFTLVTEPVTLRGQAVPAFAYASPVNIQAVGPERAVATGDFTVVGDKVEPLLEALARHGVTATAVHSHLVGESPHLYYVHFWADGPVADVVRGIRAALDAVR